jgi:methyl-accepting chemotaxis protein-1 (serine sensor receptor)
MLVIDKARKTFLSKDLTADEASHAKVFEQSYAKLLQDGIQPAIVALRANDIDAARQLMLQKIQPLNGAVAQELDYLIKLQTEIAKQEFDTAMARYQSMRALSVGAILAGVLLAAFLAFRLIRTISLSMKQAIAAAEAVAHGDLTYHIDVKGKDEIAQLLQALSNMQLDLVKVVSQVRQGSESVASASTQIAQGNQDLSARTESQASALEETAASMEELGSTVKQNADNAKLANQLAQSASGVAVQGGQVVAQVVGTMKGISDSSKKIADIIGVIDGIAFQTNILALNAAVEAARAGEQGRGFAVVASEVRSLAGRSADAAKEIKRLITESVGRVDQGTALVDQAGTTMQEIVTSIRRVTDIMGEISAASSEQSAGVAQVGEAVNQMDQATQQNAALVEEMAAAASSMNQQSNELVQAVAVFKLGSERAHVSTPTLERVATRSAQSSTYTGVERRGPGRAKNVTRLPNRAVAKQSAAAMPRPVLAKTGTDDWESF